MKTKVEFLKCRCLCSIEEENYIILNKDQFATVKNEGTLNTVEIEFLVL